MDAHSPAIDTTQIIEQLKAGAPALLAEYPVRLAYVYGSVARGQATPLSDVDVGVLFDKELGYEQFKLLAHLMWKLQEKVDSDCEFDVRGMNKMPILLLGEIMRDGVLIYARDQNDRLAYEHSVRQEYAVERPRLEAYYRAYLRNLREELRARHR